MPDLDLSWGSQAWYHTERAPLELWTGDPASTLPQYQHKVPTNSQLTNYTHITGPNHLYYLIPVIL